MSGRSADQRKHPRSLRIIAGEWRGRRIRFPPGTGVRPTPDRARETLFNWLRERVHGARCLDLFAGSGILGFEALSRGAAEVWFVERDPVLADAIDDQARRLGARARVVRVAAERFVEQPPAERFDLVFLDPPYAAALETVLARLPAMLATDALVYVERAARDGLPAMPSLAWLKTSRAGAVAYGLAAVGPGRE